MLIYISSLYLFIYYHGYAYVPVWIMSFMNVLVLAEARGIGSCYSKATQQLKPKITT